MATHGGGRRRENGERHSLRLHAPTARGHAANFRFRIENLTQIRGAYGAGAAEAAVAHLRVMVSDCLGGMARVRTGAEGAWVVEVSEAEMSAGRVLNREPSRWLEDFCHLVALAPCVTPEGAIHLFVTGEWTMGGDGRTPLFGECLAHYYGLPVGQGDLWRARYRIEMARVASVVAALDCDPGLRQEVSTPLHLGNGWQAVRDARCAAAVDGAVLYYQAQPVLVDPSGGRLDFSEVRPLLERLGFAAVVDGHLVEWVMRELEEDPDVVLGIGISAHSVGETGWWKGIESRLKYDPAVARRLIVEITDSASIPDIAAAANFVRRMQRLGCRVAIDNFGIGFASIREVVALAPDILRVDPFFLEWSARQPLNGPFEHFAGFAQTLASTVIACGVADEAQSRLALAAGVQWQQGGYCSATGMARPWRFRRHEPSHPGGASDGTGELVTGSSASIADGLQSSSASLVQSGEFGDFSGCTKSGRV